MKGETMRFMRLFWGVVLVYGLVGMAHANEAFTAESLSLNRFEADKPIAQLLWLPSEYGVLPEEVQMAKQLQAKQISVVIPDLFESYFLPTAPSSLQKIPPAVIADFIQQRKAEQPQLPLYIVAPNRAAALAVKALVQVQQPQAVHNIGLILLNPNLYIKTPEAGKSAEYWPSVAQLNLPVMVLQAELSPWRWHLLELVEKLSSAGSDVFFKLVPKVRDRYYFRPDAMDIEQQTAQQLVPQLMQSMALLSSELNQPRQALAKAPVIEPPVSSPAEAKASSDTIPVYRGEQNRRLVLQDLQGRQVDLKTYQGKVVLLNFWASWCPPCVHEIPSMVKLKNQLKDQPFEILAVNLAEEKPAIEAFIQKHPVNFPILLDPNGTVVKEWKVFAYPSTYLIDKKGQIRYALFGGYDWSSPTALKTVKSLLDE